MSGYQCNLCSHVFEETQEPNKWEELQDEWVCPICGSPKSAFAIIKKENLAPGVVTETQKIAFEKHECGLCSFVYDESAEESLWKDLSSDWQCSGVRVC